MGLGQVHAYERTKEDSTDCIKDDRTRRREREERGLLDVGGRRRRRCQTISPPRPIILHLKLYLSRPEKWLNQCLKKSLTRIHGSGNRLKTELKCMESGFSSEIQASEIKSLNAKSKKNQDFFRTNAKG